MKTVAITLSLILVGLTTFSQNKLITKSGHAKFYSHTVVEDIEANNYKVISSIDPSTGVVVFSIPMQSFEFEKSLMQKHYNSPKFVDTQQFPKAKFKGQIENISKLDFTKDGTYEIKVSGDLSMHGKTKHLTEKGSIMIKDGEVTVKASFKLRLADYEIAFEKGKPAKNIAKEVTVSLNLNY
ncbi:MAG: YceI family protein [Flavobacteriales bacterium]|nr:YceI family protein [Flavobacteriales bacterium]